MTAGIPFAPDCDLCAKNKAGLQRDDGRRVCSACQDIQPITPARCDDADCYCCDGDDAEIEPLAEDYNDDGEDDRTVFDLNDDAEALASAGWGTDEDYGYFGGDD